MSRLRISEVADVTFGGLRSHRVDGLGHDFVVVYGPNEAGKSTIAEFIAWMIAGPAGNAASARRFGSVGAIVNGRLLGSVGDEALDIEGKFRILDRGSPSDTPNNNQPHPRRGTMAGGPVDGTVLRTMFGGITPSQFSLLFRLHAETMHLIDSESDLVELFSRYATGAIESDVDPRGAVKNLEDRLADLKRQAAAFTGTNGFLTSVEQQIREASAAPARLRTLDGEISSKQADIEALGRELVGIAAEVGVIKAVISSFDKKSALAAAELELAGTPSVPQQWERIVDVLAQVEELASDMQALEARIADARPEAHTASSAVGVAVTDLATHVITDDVKRALREGAKAVREGADKVSAARDVVAAAEAQVLPADDHVRLALTQASVAESVVAHLTGNVDALRSLANDAQSADTAHRAVATAADVLAAARIKREEAERAVANATGQGDTQAKKNPPAAIILAVTALAAAGVAFVSAPVSAGIAVAGVIAAFFVSSRGAKVTADTTGGQSDLVAVVHARRGDESSAITAHETAAAFAASQLSAFNSRLSALGLPSAPGGGALTHLGNLDNAVTALSERFAVNSRIEAARAELAQAVTSADITRTTYEKVATQQGLAVAPPADAVDSWIDMYAASVTKATQYVGLEADLAAKRSELSAYVQGIAELEDAPATEVILARVRDMKSVKQAHDDVVTKVNECRRDLGLVIGDQHAVREMLDRTPSVESAKEELSLLEIRRADLEAQRSEADQAVGALRRERNESPTEELLPGLLEQKSTLEESLEDILHRYAVTSVALEAVRTVIDQFELDNQGPVVESAQSIINAVDPRFGSLLIDRASGSPVLRVVRNGVRIDVSQLSTGARTVVYLALRLAFVDVDSRSRAVDLPLLCDDPAVSLDDERLGPTLALLGQASRSRQVIMFTCHRRTVEIARDLGAHVVNL